jgi:uncharacterized protein with von Willebrand factor type A (vWA) domain
VKIRQVLIMSAALGLACLGTAVPQNRRAVPSLLVLIDADVSGSVSPQQRRQLFGLVYLAIDQVLPARFRMVLCSFDREVRKLYVGQPYDNRELWPVEDQILRWVSRQPRGGTFPARVLEQNLRDLRQARGVADVAVMLLTDGEDSQPARTRGLVAKLAAFNQLKAVWVIGVSTAGGQDLRGQVERTFAVLGPRLIVSSRHELKQGLMDFRRELRGERE